MICVIATIELAEGRREDFLGEFRTLVPKVLAEEGCIEYGPWVDVPTVISAQPDPRGNVVTVVEKWEGVEALETHLIAEHMRQFRKATEQMRVGSSLQIVEPG
jgi:quinol monooxygenase YgiN